MKNINPIKILILCICFATLANTAKAQNDADPAITSLTITPSPIFVNQQTTLNVFVTNAGFTTDVAPGSFALNIALPTTGQYAAFPESVAALGGDYMSKFTWTYNTGTKTFRGVSNSLIAPGDGGNVQVTIKGYNIASNIPTSASLELINPAAYPNDNTTNDNLTASLSVNSGVLAVNLISFDAVKQNKTVALKWTTASSTNHDYFDVQTSTDGSNWKSIGTVQAAANSNTQQQYSLIHSNPVTGINYYRLRSVELNGSSQFSVTRKVDFNAGSVITIAPNPTKDKVFITALNATSIKAVLIYSNDGKLMQSVNNFVSGRAIDVQSYAPGIYMIKIIYADQTTQTEKLIKQ